MSCPKPKIAAAAPEDAPNVWEPDERPLVLIVDDNPDHRELLSFVLKQSGYRTCEAADGAEGFAAARRERPDLVVSDVMMPMTDGISMCRMIRADDGLRNVPILLVSAMRKDTASVIAALQAGADDYMESPFEPLRLVARVARFVERQRGEAAMRDSLERKVAERTRQLAEANRELQMFIYSVSHDLRSPLVSTRNYLRLLSRQATGELGESEAELLRLAEARLSHTTEMISRLLDFSCAGRDEMHTEEVCLEAVARAAAEALREDAEGREVRWRIGPLPCVSGDPSLLELAVRNLFCNALKYTRRREVAEIEIGGGSRGGEAILYVRDNGVGFEPRLAGELFQLFRRLHHDEEFEGTGVGLASVRRIVERHGGRVWAEGRPGEGATFWLSLPFSAARSDFAQATLTSH